MSKFFDSTSRRPRWRHLLPLALLALVPIVLAPAGSATRPPVTKFTICVQNTASQPSCSGADASSVQGNASSTVQVTIINDGTSTTAIGSADIVVPPQLHVHSGTAMPSKYVKDSAQHLLFTGINIPAGKSFVATFTAEAACGGAANWSTATAYASSDLSAPAFSAPGYVRTASSTTNIITGCHLGFVTQPSDTPNSAQPLWVGGSATGGPIKVGLFSDYPTQGQMTDCPTGFSPCSVDIGLMPADGGTLTNGGGLTQPLLQDVTNGNARTATFSSSSISAAHLPQQFRLTATGDSVVSGDFAPIVHSGSFLIATSVSPIPCDGNGNCGKNQQSLPGTGLGANGLTDSFADVTGVTNFNFMTLSPYTLTGTPLGCKGEDALPKPLGVTGFAESDGRAGTVGTLTINYYVNVDNIKARYGRNVGQQFIPLCVGGRPVDANGTAHDCDDPSFASVGWAGDELNLKTGAFTGNPATAVCNPDGYYWGILGSFQDKIPAGNPVVTGWGGTSVNSTNYRVFTMSIPPNWDWRSGP